MSIPFGNETRHNVNVPHAKRFVVEKERQPESLAEYVQRVRNEKNLSLMDVSRRSGGLIANAHISRIENGLVKSAGVEKLRALAKGLGISEEEIFAVARGKVTSGDLAFDELRMLELYRKLSPEKRMEAVAHLEVAFQFQAGGHEPRRHPTASVSIGSSKRSEKKRA
jgi:transcriptional regulator with XRE-family HTH domain